MAALAMERHLGIELIPVKFESKNVYKPAMVKNSNFLIN